MPDPRHLAQPPLTLWGHLWRSGACLVLSAPVVLNAVVNEGSLGPLGLPGELLIGAFAWVAMFLRRRRPLLVALVCVLCGAVSSVALGPAVLTLVSLATWRRAVPLVVVSAAAVLGQAVSSLLLGDGDGWTGLVLSAGYVAVAAGWGLYLGSRRALVAALRERARQAEAEQQLRQDRARTEERARIAREMHDVVAHRINQVVMLTGAYDARADLPVETLREGNALVGQTARQALQELRGVLGVLRDADAREVAPAPQPTWADVTALVTAERDLGREVELVEELEAPLPDELGRTLYRLVQEAVTNAGRHAPGAPLRLRLAGGPGPGAELRATNPLTGGEDASSAAGSGWGLVGMAERVELLGGRLEHGTDAHGFTLRAWLPWPT